MKRYDVIVVGAGPAGLSASIECASRGMRVGLFDENNRPGGQLFKQIHKFFGSKEHHAKMRGFKIGIELLDEAKKAGVDIHLSSIVTGIFYPMKEIAVSEDGEIKDYRADSIIVATGANENTLPFKGWTLPGVMGAGAAQTMMNLHGTLPGKRILMVGSGNVGLVVGYQLLQAGCEVTEVIDALPKIGGYGVHAAKLARTGVPFRLGYTIVRAEGTDHVERAVIAKVDEHFQIIEGTEETIDVDTICIAVGLTPMSKLLAMTGCETVNMGGTVPKTNEYGETSIEGLYAAGDVAGIEEASSAMVTGRISAIAAAYDSGFIDEETFKNEYEKFCEMLSKLRQGMFSKAMRGKKITATQEGYPISENLLKKGYLLDEEVFNYPGVKHIKGIHPVIECTQNIPCNPCQEACHFGCIKVGQRITDLPDVAAASDCRNCGNCVASCPGQAIFLVNDDYDEESATVTLPYEFLPLPEEGTIGKALDRSGREVCEAQVISVVTRPAYDHTNLLTIKVPKEMSMKARFFKLS